MKTTKHLVRKKLRLENYDYRSPGYYHIVILTHKRQNLLGNIDQGIMTSSPFGQVLKEILENISDRMPNIEIIKFQVMPDHVHILINLFEIENTENSVSISDFVSRIKTFSVWKYRNERPVENYQNLPTKVWHRSFYDHILRSIEEAELTFKYIEYNPDQFE